MLALGFVWTPISFRTFRLCLCLPDLQESRLILRLPFAGETGALLAAAHSSASPATDALTFRGQAVSLRTDVEAAFLVSMIMVEAPPERLRLRAPRVSGSGRSPLWGQTSWADRPRALDRTPALLVGQAIDREENCGHDMSCPAGEQPRPMVWRTWTFRRYARKCHLGLVLPGPSE